MEKHRYTKQTAITIVTSCAKQYENELNNRCLLLFCIDKHKKLYTVEVTFRSHHFLHLTGLKLVNRFKNEPDSTEFTAKDFYSRCLNQKLSLNDFDFSEDETTFKKLDILPYIICKNLHANSIGDFHGQRPKLMTDKIIGSIKACVGFVKDSGEYVPNTVVQEDIRNITKNPLRIVAVFRKNISDTSYEEITYIGKKVDWDSISFPDKYMKQKRKLIENNN